MNRVDCIVLAVIAITALAGLKRGLVATALSLGGLAAGAVIGSRLAPRLFEQGSHSPYTPLVALGGALAGALVLQGVASIAGSFARGGLSVVPPLRVLDSIGGLVAGLALGLAAVWVAGAALLQLPGQTTLRRDVQSSEILRRVNEVAPPGQLLRAFARFDPFEQIVGPAPPSIPPDRRVLASAGVRVARSSVVRITATACGLGVEGSGWAARPHLVVTAAHVVAGASGILAAGHVAQPLVVDRRHDVAVLRVRGLGAAPLGLADPHSGDGVAILGFPENGPFDARPGRIGSTADVLLNGSLREVTAVSGLIRHGNSGGPAVNAAGDVEATIFAARVGGGAGYGVPASAIRRALGRAHGPVSTGSC